MIVLAALLGVASHYLYFIHGERDYEVMAYAFLLGATPAALVSTLHFAAGHTPMQAVHATAVLMLSYLAALAASIVVYRLWFHPVAGFPGPFAARITKLYYPWAYVRSSAKYHELQRTWFAAYGRASASDGGCSTVVRTGPNEVMVRDPALLPALARAKKGAWYIIGRNMLSLQLLRDVQTHSIRRRVWDRALTARRIESYLPAVHEHARMLVDALGRRGGEAGEADITSWLAFYSFDTMGAITYGRSFGMLEKAGGEGSRYFLDMTRESMRMVGLLGPVPWTMLLLEGLGIGRAHAKFMRWCGTISDQRMSRGGDGDLFSVLLDAEPTNVGEHHVPLAGDSRLAIIAGSDTTAFTLVMLLAHLAEQPDLQARLWAEIEACPDNTPFLDACIGEALRLHPSVASGTPRTSPPEGLVLADGTRIPSGVNVILPLYALQRDPDRFDEPDHFIPDRWIDSSPDKLAAMQEVFQPFWLGRYQCAGKALAYAQMRIVIATIVQRYSFRFKHGWSLARAIDSCRDIFTAEVGPIWCVFTEREGAGMGEGKSTKGVSA